MDEVERMLICQRHRIQRVYHVPFAFNTLEPQFHNELRAYFNKWRSWTTRARYGTMDSEFPSYAHAYPPSTPFNPEAPHSPTSAPDQSIPGSHTPRTTHAAQSSHVQQDNEHATLNSAIFSLSLNRGPVPPTPANSPASSPDDTQSPSNHTIHAIPPLNQNAPSNIPTDSPPDQETQNNSTMQWMWVNGDGPFMTNGEFREVTESSSATKNDFETVVMFNLDRLNEDRPEWLRGFAWERGQIPESTDGLINSLAHRVDRNGIQADLEDLRNGPGIGQPNTLTQTHFTTQSMPGSEVENTPTQTVSLDTGLDTIRPSGVADTDLSTSSPTSVRSEPSVLGCLGCDQERRNFCRSSRKRIGIDLGRFRRNIRQNLMCGLFTKEDDKGFPLLITFVYAHPDHAKRGEVWQRLRSLKQHSHPSWLCIGDFNQVISKEDKLSLTTGNIIGLEEFQQVLGDLQLCDLTASGQRFTWMNKREEDDFVMERLDRAFGSIEWVNRYPFYSLRNLPIVRSDHGPIILDLEVQIPFRKRPFQFECMWLTHVECKEMVQTA
nr:hypothetical protein CFP56_49333 [Quercus suber]